MKANRRRARCRVRGFTLLEVMMVVIIIGLLAAFVAPSFFGVEEKQKIKLAQAAVDSGLGNALPTFRATMGRYPTEEEGLMVLYEPPDDEEEAEKWVQLIKKPSDLKDPWGNDYIFQCPGEYNESSYDLSSPGPDGEEGGDDDVTNWEEA